MGNLMGILAIHVDDFVFWDNDLFQKNVIAELKKIFQIETHENGTFKFWGLGVRQTKDGITINQNLYVSSLSLKKCNILTLDRAINQEMHLCK